MAPKLVFVLLAAGLAAGCGSGSARHGASTASTTLGSAAGTSSGAKAADAGAAKGLNTGDCSSVPASRVNAALGTSVSDPKADTAGNAVMCGYAGGGNPMAVIIRIEGGSTLDEMQTVRKQGDAAGVKSADLSGLGDAAYSTAISTPGLPTVTSVDAQKGALNVQVTSTASLDKIKAFVAQLIG